MTKASLDLDPRYQRILESLIQTHLPHVEVWVYGSRVNGRSYEGSDLDLVLRDPDMKELPPEQIKRFQKALRESRIPILVEAREWLKIPVSFHEEIERSHIDLSTGIRDGEVPHGWCTITIDEISERVGMGPFGSSIKVDTFASEGIPIISGKHLKAFSLDDNPGFNYITEEHATKLSNANVGRGDVIFTHAGNIGQVAYIPEDSVYKRYVLSQRQFYMRCDTSKVIPEFVAAYFHSREGKHKLLANASQVGVPSIAQPVSYLRTIELPLPSIGVQRMISNILVTLNKKIESNRIMSRTLEEIAESMFKSWFVDFEPVHSKIKREDTKFAKLLEQVFPSSFSRSGSVVVPSEWTRTDLGTLCERPQYGYTASAIEKPEGPQFLRIKDINKEAWIDWSSVPYCQITEKDKVKYGLETGDILIARMADPGHNILIEEPIEAVFASYLIRFRLKDPVYTRYIQYWLRSDSYWNQVMAQSVGTTRFSLNAKVLSSFTLLVPNREVARVFANLVGPLRDRILCNVAENRALVEMRDSMLPRLISGELKVSDAEHLVENVT